MPAKNNVYRALEPVWDEAAKVVRKPYEEFEIANKAAAESLIAIGSIVPVAAEANEKV